MTEPTELLPCPFCGHSGPLNFQDGSTHRWGVAYCAECGASAGETRREYPDVGEWHAKAIAQWNARTPQPTQAQADTPCRKNPFYHGPRNCSRGTVGCCEDHGPKTQAQAGAVPLTDEPCAINHQGPRLNHALSETHGDVCIIYVDFGCKRFNVSGTGSADDGPSVSIDPCEPSQGWEYAEVTFPNRSGWDVVSASSSKYTLTAVLKRCDHGIKGGQHGSDD